MAGSIYGKEDRMNNMKKLFYPILFTIVAVAYVFNAFAQIPKVSDPACAYCGIKLTSQTKPWDHEKDCPYYSPEPSSFPDSDSSKEEENRVVNVPAEPPKPIIETVASPIPNNRNGVDHKKSEKEIEEERVYITTHNGFKTNAVKNKYDDGYKFGYVHYGTNNWAIPPIYDIAYDFNWERGRVCKLIDHHLKWGYINKNGVEVIPLIYSDAEDFSEGYAPVWKEIKVNNSIKKKYNIKTKGRYFTLGGFINLHGNEVIPMQYHSLGKVSGGLVAVMQYKGGKIGFLDISSKQIVIPFQYELMPGDYSWSSYMKHLMFKKYEDEWFCIVKKEGKYGVIDRNGKEVLPISYNTADITIINSGQFFIVRKEDKYGIVDRYGKVILPIIYHTNDITVGTTGQYFVINKDGKYGIINTDGKEIIPFQFSKNEAIKFIEILYSEFYKKRMDKEIKEWERHKTNETADEYNHRTASEKKTEWLKLKQYTILRSYKVYILSMIQKFCPSYNSDNQIYTIAVAPPFDFMRCEIPVPAKEVPALNCIWDNSSSGCQLKINIKVENDLPQISYFKIIIPAKKEEESKSYSFISNH